MIEGINRRLIIGSPAMRDQNGDRILRLPFTYNLPDRPSWRKGARSGRPRSSNGATAATRSRLAEMFPPIRRDRDRRRNFGDIDLGAAAMSTASRIWTNCCSDKLTYERRGFADFDALWQASARGLGHIRLRLLDGDGLPAVEGRLHGRGVRDGRHGLALVLGRGRPESREEHLAAFAGTGLGQGCRLAGQMPKRNCPERPEGAGATATAQSCPILPKVSARTTEGHDPSDYRPGHDAGEDDPVGGDAGQRGGDGQGRAARAPISAPIHARGGNGRSASRSPRSGSSARTVGRNGASKA